MQVFPSDSSLPVGTNAHIQHPKGILQLTVALVDSGHSFAVIDENKHRNQTKYGEPKNKFLFEQQFHQINKNVYII